MHVDIKIRFRVCRFQDVEDSLQIGRVFTQVNTPPELQPSPLPRVIELLPQPANENVEMQMVPECAAFRDARPTNWVLIAQLNLRNPSSKQLVSTVWGGVPVKLQDYNPAPFISGEPLGVRLG